ncbi:hypothetical protein JY789_19060, partial [Clostridioides difficile]|nr:hypothetical protein [Clostridioides difficile]
EENKMKMLRSFSLVFILFFCVSLNQAVDVSEETIKGSDGNVYDVTDVTGDKTDIVIIKKNGKIMEQQITQIDKDYTIVKTNGTCNIQFYEESPKECNEATVPTKVPDDIKAECGDLEVVYVKSVDCPAEGEIQKRSCYIYYYWRYWCIRIWRWRRCYYRIIRIRRCY